MIKMEIKIWTSGIYFPVCCLFFSITIMLIYFSKQRLQNIENQIYKVLLISNFIGLIVEILCYYFIRNTDIFPILSNIVLRGYLFYLYFFIAVFTDYNVIITYKSKYEDRDINKFFKIILVITVLLVILAIPFLLFLPMEIFNDNNIDCIYLWTSCLFCIFCCWYFNVYIVFKHDYKC